MVDPWKVNHSKELVMDVLTLLSREHCSDCGAGNVYVTFRIKQPVGLEYFTKCRNCGKERVF